MKLQKFLNTWNVAILSLFFLLGISAIAVINSDFIVALMGVIFSSLEIILLFKIILENDKYPQAEKKFSGFQKVNETKRKTA